MTMKRFALAAGLLTIVFAVSSCYWTPETTTGSLVFTLPAISARTMDVDPPTTAQEDKDKDKDNPGGGKPDKDKDNPGGGNSDKDKDAPGGGKPGEDATEATHVRVYLLVAGTPYPSDGGNEYEEFGLSESRSSARMSFILPGDDYQVRVEIGVYSGQGGTDLFDVLLIGESHTFKVFPGRTTSVQVKLETPSVSP